MQIGGDAQAAAENAALKVASNYQGQIEALQK
jgi:hypothetical protein